MKRGAYGGLAGAYTATMLARHAIPLVLAYETDTLVGWAPLARSARVNEVEVDTDLLLGLDPQRFLELQLNVIDNTLSKLMEDGLP